MKNVILFTEEPYSNHTILGILIVDPSVEKLEHLKLEFEQLPENEVEKYKLRMKFVNWLVDEGYAEKITYREIHLGDYNDFEFTLYDECTGERE